MLLPALELVRDAPAVVDLPQRFGYPLRVHAHGAGDFRREQEAVGQRLDVAVEDESHHFAVPVDHRTSGITANDVVGGHEVEWRREVEIVSSCLLYTSPSPRD